MWVCTYILYSILLDLVFAACVICNLVVSEWLFYVRLALKIVVLAWLLLRSSSKTLEAWTAATMFVASMLFVSTICKVSSGILQPPPAMEEMIYLWVNRIVESLVLLKLSRYVAGQQVVPLPSLDTSKCVHRTCTWIELCGSFDGALDIEHLATCCICLEMMELNEVVTQLTCKHVYHTDCAAQWMLRCTTSHRGGSLCPMRCPSTETLGPSSA
eukprot:TRINITY_DN5688_c0_g1_i1.p1 TRINITY_DN5688_c0_g1~~TRINITY_DN5688_c0_g1_i1.p1  ORF type:complete len:237 (+),score=15.84 TRINITY_DN5688_c0_g1_i1:70-711(+)